MNILYWCEACKNLPLPDFGDAFRAHMAKKKHPPAYASSLLAWNLLAAILGDMELHSLPEAAFSAAGKPYFPGLNLHFSLSHSGNIAAAAVSDAPCGVDIEMIRAHTAQRLMQRCLSPEEQAAGCDFFDIWTKKECIAKLDGSGMPGHPSCINTLDAQYEGRFSIRRIADSAGNEYALAVLGQGPWRIEKRSIIR